jgi:hypothetical protein
MSYEHECYYLYNNLLQEPALLAATSVFKL